MLNFFKKTREGLKRSREGFLGKVFSLVEGKKIDDSLWMELEELLLLSDVGVKTTNSLLQSVKERIKREAVESAGVKSILKQEMIRLTKASEAPMAAETMQASKVKAEAETNFTPSIILLAGVNGSGKTTSLAKMAYSYNSAGKSVLIAAADTFRSAAIEQVEEWGKRLGIDVIHHQPGGDPGAVVFDALKAASSRKLDVVLIDTAGRLHTKYNLMEELKKIRKVITKAAPQALPEILLVLDATTGQNGLAQARSFAEAVNIDGIFLTKLDGTAKGGIVLAISQELKIPIKYIGSGEGLEDMAPFNAEAFVEALCTS